jgi:hypothetical protein
LEGDKITDTMLSHRWLSDLTKMLKLLRTNMQEYSQRVLSNASSHTFLDAVRISRALDVKYIWIDALCIFQDDALDNGW